MLTGKDVYEAARPFLKQQGFEEQTDWEEAEFGQGTQAFYNAVAENLNKAPAGGQRESLEHALKAVDELQSQVDKLTNDIKSLRDMDRKIFDDQDQKIAGLKELVRDLVEGLQDCWDNEYSLEALNDLKGRAQQLLAEKEQ